MNKETTPKQEQNTTTISPSIEFEKDLLELIGEMFQLLPRMSAIGARAIYQEILKKHKGDSDGRGDATDTKNS